MKTIHFHSFAAKSSARKLLATMFVVPLQQVIASETEGSITFKDPTTAESVAESEELQGLIYQLSDQIPIPQITPPTFTVIDPQGTSHELNEYELNALRVEIMRRQATGFRLVDKQEVNIDINGRYEDAVTPSLHETQLRQLLTGNHQENV
jgi:hypothetical protein